MSRPPLEWDILLDQRLPWAHFVACPEAELDDLAHASPAGSDIIIRVVRGQRCRTAPSLFQEWGAALQFPYYFGENWDAFEECLCDLEWLPAHTRVVFVTQLEKVLTNTDDQFRMFISILNGVAAYWNDQAGPSLTAFRILFHATPQSGVAARQRLRQAGIEIP
jgi:hypothetical protein